MIAKRTKVIIFLYLGIIIFSVTALALNIKTIPVINQTKQLQKQLSQLKELNNKLIYTYNNNINYSILTFKAQQLGLKKPALRHVKHVKLAQQSLTNDQ